MELNIPLHRGDWRQLIYWVDRYGERSIYDVISFRLNTRPITKRAGIRVLDHLTHN